MPRDTLCNLIVDHSLCMKHASWKLVIDAVPGRMSMTQVNHSSAIKIPQAVEWNALQVGFVQGTMRRVSVTD